MKLFKWQLVSRTELKQLQDLSAQGGREPLRGVARLEDPELALVAENIKDVRSSLQRELQELETAQTQLSSKLQALQAGSSKVEAARIEARLEHMQTDFIAAASHELKTPLAGIEALGDALQMALADGNTDAALAFVDSIKDETKRMRSLAEDLLDLSRFDENPEADSVSNLRTAFDQAVIMPARTAQAQGVSLQIEYADGLPEAALAKISPTDLSIILDNLLDNALHYTSDGQIVLSLERSDDRQRWLISVSDTGTGIAEADQAFVFDRFYRADRSRSRDYGGTGLGLSLVKKAAERWNGQVSLQSQLGSGSVFSVKLPVA
ncbi:MAG: HAMP domain-containing histidine kinase [Coriobacteriia bacterium]|nr:HAMP domain-containing histidine kinase [Coriobacteriia bacterium]MCL2537074.1 HAMP domain-containing histidine kinase [Coriobacteriia bacterium]